MNKKLQERINNKPKDGLLTATANLEHLSIITYKVPINRLKNHIPDLFDIYTITIDNKTYGLVSAVTFIDNNLTSPEK